MVLNQNRPDVYLFIYSFAKNTGSGVIVKRQGIQRAHERYWIETDITERQIKTTKPH